MTDMFYIDEKRTLPIAQQYEWLRLEGMRHIQQLGHAFWTDYNAHDPGITLLEAIVYALTEISYRNHFAIADLLTSPDGQIHNNTFFTAKKILTTAPLTAKDYRKILIDINGVANAWFIATQNTQDADGYFEPHAAEQKIYLNKREDKLSFSDTNIFGETLTETLSVRGLNKVLLELEEDARLGDLNSTTLEFAVYVDEHWIEMLVIPTFAQWTAAEAIIPEGDVLSIAIVKNELSLALSINVDTIAGSNLLSLSLHPKEKDEIDLLEQQLQIPGNTIVTELLARLVQKQHSVNNIYKEVYQVLQRNRNIGEDFLAVETVQTVNIAVCANIALRGDVDPIGILQQIYALTDEMFSPSVEFHSLGELLDKGLPGDEIFNGPVLQHGFLSDETLEKTRLPKCLHASDLIAAIMGIDGVLAVHDVLLSALDDKGKAFNDQINQPWTIKLDGLSKPRFSTTFSKINLYREQLPVFISEANQKLLTEFMQMRHLQKQQLKSLYAYQDIDLPGGTYYALQTYTSIQRELPAVYAVGGNQLMPDASESEKAQSKQLKAYLHFFDQLLADLFNQLSHAKELLDSGELTDTYFPQFLAFNPDSTDPFDSAEIFGADLETAMQDPFFAGKESIFLDRRHRSIDHLMARFSESFSDYAFMMYQSGHATETSAEQQSSRYELLKDKTEFLNQYDQISYSRGTAMDYLHAQWQIETQHWLFSDFWESEHRSGYERRVARLLGIDVVALSNIFPENSPQTEMSFQTASGQLTIKILQPAINLNEKWDWLQLHIGDVSVYSVQKIIKKYGIFLMDDGKKIAQIDITFATLDDAEAMKTELLQSISDAFENFYFLEHILLRPFPVMQNDQLDLLPVCLQDECTEDTGADPYSFRATVVLPGYQSRFSNIAFRRYAEKIFRQEAPAHVMLKICWVGKDDMILFQHAYRNWLESYRVYRLAYGEKSIAIPQPTIDEFVLHHRQLVEALQKLNTLYPEGNLFDCNSSETVNPMILGSSSLGTLK